MSKGANRSIEHCVKITRFLINVLIALRNFLFCNTKRHQNDIGRLVSTLYTESTVYTLQSTLYTSLQSTLQSTL